MSTSSISLENLSQAEFVQIAVSVLESRLDAPAVLSRMHSPEACRRGLLPLAAVAYVRGDLIAYEVADTILAVLRSEPGGESLRLTGEVLKCALIGPDASRVFEAVVRALSRTGISPDGYDVLLQSLEFAASWAKRPDGIAQELLQLLELPHLQPHRRRILEGAVEPLLYTSAEPQSLSGLDRVARFWRDDSGFKYFLYFTGPRSAAPGDVRQAAAKFMAGAFPLQDVVSQHFLSGARRVLIVQNIRDGQGDEIIRCVPLMQAFLDSNPRLEIVLVTNRAYLYAHPRVTPVPISDITRVDEQVRSAFDAVIDFFEPNIVECNYREDLEAPVQQNLRRHAPKLVLVSDKGFNRFFYQRVEVEGRCYARELGLDRQRVKNVYETTFRLIAELGLHPRSGQQKPVSEWVLAGTAWPLANTEWSRLTGTNSAKRPVALLNPFGGTEPLKGYDLSRIGGLSAQIRRLIAQGFFVIVVPNGTPWGSLALAREAVQTLAQTEQQYVSLAPDAAASAGDDQPAYGNSGFLYADTVTRLLTYFVRFADLIVAVEGWMIHAAYCLGKPYRILMMPYSHPPEWHPYAQGGEQCIEQPAFGDPFGSLSSPVEQPRKFTLMALLVELRDAGDPLALPLFERAVRSPDRDVRTAAARALARFREPATRALLAGLIQDPFHLVRGAAAESFLTGANEDAAAPVTREQLLTHAWIAEPQRSWMKILLLGQAALPALEIASRDEDPVVRREASWALAFVRGPRQHRALSRAARVLRGVSRLVPRLGPAGASKVV